MATVAELIDARSRRAGPGLLSPDGLRYQHAEIAAQAAARAALFGGRHRPGMWPHIGVPLGNTDEFVFWPSAAALAGAALVGVNPARRGAELARDVRHAECEVLITSRARLRHRGRAAGPRTFRAPLRLSPVGGLRRLRRRHQHRVATKLPAIGELVHTGPGGFTGHWNNPAADAERYSEGRYRSGDLFYADTDGWLYFAARKADRMRVDGENISVALLEAILARWQPVEAVAAYAVPTR